MLLEGLKLFVHPLQINQLKQSTQSLIYKLIHLLYERNFGHLLTMAQQDISYFNYTLELVGEGLQSTQSIPMLTSFECVSPPPNLIFL